MLPGGHICRESNFYRLRLPAGAVRKEGLDQLTSSRIEEEWNSLVPIEARISADKKLLECARVLGAFPQRSVDQDLDRHPSRPRVLVHVTAKSLSVAFVELRCSESLKCGIPRYQAGVPFP
jgi:hypothetical protein